MLYTLVPIISAFLGRDVNKGFAEVTEDVINRGPGEVWHPVRIAIVKSALVETAKEILGHKEWYQPDWFKEPFYRRETNSMLGGLVQWACK